MSHANINQSVNISVEVFSETVEFNSAFSPLQPAVKYFLQWTLVAGVRLAKAVMAKVKK